MHIFLQKFITLNDMIYEMERLFEVSLPNDIIYEMERIFISENYSLNKY